MRNGRLLAFAVLTLVTTCPVFAQRGHVPGAANGSSTSMSAAGNHNASMGATNGNATSLAKANPLHAAPSNVLSQNSELAAKIKALTGQEAALACAGFSTIGECIAAAHVVRNLNIPGGFSALKSAMTSGSGMSLSQAIESLIPSINAKSQSKTANKQAQQDLQGTNF